VKSVVKNSSVFEKPKNFNLGWNGLSRMRLKECNGEIQSLLLSVPIREIRGQKLYLPSKTKQF